MRKWLKELREKKNLKQSEVAKLLGVAPSYYCMIENGERQSKMKIDTAQKLAKVFDVPLVFILQNEMQRNFK
nr:MAG TPA: Helix-turn-helix XRE-family like protein [Caudoviricetes sp.]